MRVLQLYNRYQSGGGGETRVVELVEEALRAKQHTVCTLIRDSKDVGGTLSKMGLFFTAAYSPSAKKEIHREILDWQPDIVHVHNLYPFFSPSVLSACKERNVPVVMSVHNYGLSCPVATHFRNGKLCQSCLGGHEYECIAHNCKNDMTKSVSYSFRSYVARVCGQFTNGVTLFLAISQFLKDKLIEAGLPADRIVVLENAVPMPESVEPYEGDYVAYFGRMQTEKGVETLLAAARRLPEYRFLLVGDGPERSRWAASAPANCSFLGHQERNAVEQIYKHARFTVVPSTWWEPFGMVVVEAMSYGKPVIASRSGALPELIQDGVTGLTFDPDDVDGLTRNIQELWSDPLKSATMGTAARDYVSRQFNLPRFADKLVEYYSQAQQIVHAQQSVTSRS